MRTIIINTLGNELRQNQLFYLPFQADRFHWIEKPLADISQCPQEIVAYQSEQGQRQDYHVILLVSLAHLKSSELKAVRQVYVQTLRAYLNEKFLLPLCQQLQMPPAGVSVVFMLEEKADGQGDVETDRELDRIFGFTEDMQQLAELTLKDENGSAVLNVTDLFADSVEGYLASLEQQKKEPLAGANYALEQLRRHMLERIHAAQECRYIPVGREHTVTVNSQALEFAPLTTDWSLCCLDIQLNLSEHLQAHLGSDSVWQLELIPHDAQTLRKRIAQAISRVRYLQQDAPRLAFYELEEPASGQPPKDISGEIWTELLANTQLPGIEEAKAEAELEQEEKDAHLEGKALATKLRKSWLLIGLEKKRFDSYCEIMDQQFAPEFARKQQRDVLDICAKVFGQWRRKVLSRKEAFPTAAKAIQLPVFDGSKYEKELDEAQKKWGAATVKQLDDYEDVRQQAEQIKADFRKEYRLWPDGNLNATTKFCVYSIVLAVLFLIQMLVPYISITMAQSGVSGLAHFGMSLLTFLCLYGVGVLFWMRGMCKRLHKHTTKMYLLLQDSHRRRRQSIAQAVEIYGSVLPQCTLSYEQLQRLREIHQETLQRKERYNTHMQLLNKAEELLYEMRTLLRMQGSESVEVPRVTGGINYEKAPSHPENVPYYVFMSEKWGR